MTDPDRFSEWFDKVSEGARASPIGEIMVALGYDVEHTDGGGLSWGRRHGKVLAMICDEGNGLGDSVDEPYFAGLHGDEGDFVECNEMLPTSQQRLSGSTMHLSRWRSAANGWPCLVTSFIPIPLARNI